MVAIYARKQSENSVSFRFRGSIKVTCISSKCIENALPAIPSRMLSTISKASSSHVCQPYNSRCLNIFSWRRHKLIGTKVIRWFYPVFSCPSASKVPSYAIGYRILGYEANDGAIKSSLIVNLMIKIKWYALIEMNKMSREFRNGLD